MKKPFEPKFNTPESDFSKEEINKLNASRGQDNRHAEFNDDSKDDLTWETEQLAKSYGIYLEFDRACEEAEKHWYNMIRIATPGGGPINKDQWKLFDELSEKHCKNPYGNPSVRFTNRQAIQFHWIKKNGVRDIVKTIAEGGFNSLNGCGDNTRNVLATPLSKYSTVFNGSDWAHKVGSYFQLPVEPFIKVFAIEPGKVRKPGESFKYGPKLLNRKFKIAFGGVLRDASGKLIPDNSTELRTNDLGISPIIDGDKVTRFQVYVGGGQGERNGKPAMSTLGLPLCVASQDELLKVMDAIVQVHQAWGDRQNRHWARLKYVIKKMGVEWYRQEVEKILGRPLQKPLDNHDVGDRQLYFGWNKQETNGLWSFGMYIENGRVIDGGPNGNIKSLIRNIMDKYNCELYITPNQDAIFSNIPENKKEEFAKDLNSYGWGHRFAKPYSELRLRSGACVGRDTCRLTYTDSERFEPELIDKLEEMGWGHMRESIGITGCERQCFRPGTKTIGLVGTGYDRYMFKLFGDEGGRHQGIPLISSDGTGLYLRSIGREEVPIVIDALFRNYTANQNDHEDMGAFHRRIGADALIDFLKKEPATSAMMGKPFTTDFVIDPMPN